MANRLYGKYKKAAVSFSNAGLGAAIDLATDTIKCALVTSGYTPNTADTGDQFYSSVSANVLGTPQTLTFTSDTSGLFKATIPTFSNVPAGTVTQLVIYKDTGSNATSPVIAVYDATQTVTAAAGATIGAGVTIAVDPLVAPIASGTVITFTGGGVATLTASAALGARSITANLATANITANATGSAAISGAGLPVTSNGSSFNITITPDATFGWFTI